MRRAGSAPSSVPAFAVGQGVNVRRHLDALRDFHRSEFGTGVARPSEGHVQAVNDLLERLRRPLEAAVVQVESAGRATRGDDLGELLRLKSRAHDWVRATERVWDFYFELFGQRQGAFGDWLHACDKIALDCYQHVHMHLGTARSIPSPGPFAYMRTGFSPATYRRNIPLRKLGRQLNPFPLVQLPYHRMVNPWTMGAVLHEVCHNLQNELGLEDEVPRAIHRACLAAGLPPSVARTWARWDRETFADLVGCMLGGEAFVASLMDVIGRAPEQVLAFSPHGVHPTPYLRTFLSTHLLRRMGFGDIARDYERLWRRLYPSTAGTTIPQPMLRTLPEAVQVVVDAVCWTKFPSLGDRSLRQVITFAPRQQSMIEEAAGRLARGVDPGVVPERFLIGAVRIAVDRKLAAPDVLMRNFYSALSGT
ncbi:hypothetical protein H5V45_04005 [Nocardioides sp. KIGAM211]|uniref:Uncharacterized protein n=1 Tax=Nocardioides luti TaxID=2761101 RepID=A0A7X0RDW8_9ACTN|nr:hypothetical protein [Nocardioides luti]